MDKETIKNLVPGDWINMAYGFKRHDWYVLRVFEGHIVIGKPGWPVSSHITMSYDELSSGHCKPLYLGKTGMRWWWKYLPYFNNAICPFKRLRVV